VNYSSAGNSEKTVYSFRVLKFGYMAMILFTVFGSFWLEIVLKIGVLRRVKRVLFSILPVAIFTAAFHD